LTAKDTVVVPISDMHSGGSTALFPNYMMQFENANVSPKDEQKDMFAHWTACAEEIAKVRKGKRLLIVHDGDATEGWHHNTSQVVTMLENEQIRIHTELMDHFLQIVKFGSGDDLYYVKGTEVHTNGSENVIGEDLDATPCGEFYAWEELKLEENGIRLWFTHHGPIAGDGANFGNSFRNWLKNKIFYECVNNGVPIPHYIITGHTHKPCWTDYVGRHERKYHRLQGLICPSWQKRTRFGHRAAPLQLGDIGLQYFVISKDGLISDPVERLMR